MPDLKHSTAKEVARRMRKLAASLTDPDDIAAAEAYAKGLERSEPQDRDGPTLGDTRDREP